MNQIKSVGGATLLELLVVMTIMLTLTGLVGGTSVNSIDRAAAQTEVISVYSTLKKAAARAFSSGKKVLIEFSGPDMEVYFGKELAVRRVFSHLKFNDQVVRFNRNGVANTILVKVSVRGTERSLDLRALSNASVDDKYQ